MSKNGGFLKTVLAFILSLVLIPFGFFGCTAFGSGLTSHVEISPRHCAMYTSAAKRQSKGNAIISWKQLVAIDAVRYDQDFDNVTLEEIEKLASKFIIAHTKHRKDGDETEYSLKPLEQVLDELGFDNDQKEQVKLYLSVGFEGLEDGGGNFSGPKDAGQFIELVAKGAQEQYRKYHILPSITIAQAALESGWGKSGLTAKANNLFGIKSYGWSGQSVEMITTEYTASGEEYQTVAAFRAYDSWDQSIEDHSKILLQSNFRGVREANSYVEAAYALLEGNYATDQQYPSLIIGIIEQYNLAQYDTMN